MGTPMVHHWVDEHGSRPLSELSREELEAALVRTATELQAEREAYTSRSTSLIRMLAGAAPPQGHRAAARVDWRG